MSIIPGRRSQRRRSPLAISRRAKVVSYALLLFWTFVVLFPLYWLVVTSLKLPIQVDSGPVYIPFVDFQPTLDNWRYILVDLQSDTVRPYVNTLIVGLTSSLIALILGSAAAYALVRFRYRPRTGVVGLFIGCLLFVVIATIIGAPFVLAIVSGIAVFAHPLPDHRAALLGVARQQQRRLLAHLPADAAAGGGGHPDLRAVPAPRHARHAPGADHHVRRRQPAHRRLAHARLLLDDPGRARGVGGGRRRVAVPHLPFDRPADRRARPRGDLPVHPRVRLERVPAGPLPVVGSLPRRCR